MDWLAIVGCDDNEALGDMCRFLPKRSNDIGSLQSYVLKFLVLFWCSDTTCWCLWCSLHILTVVRYRAKGLEEGWRGGRWERVWIPWSGLTFKSSCPRHIHTLFGSACLLTPVSGDDLWADPSFLRKTWRGSDGGGRMEECSTRGKCEAGSSNDDGNSDDDEKCLIFNRFLSLLVSLCISQ